MSRLLNIVLQLILFSFYFLAFCLVWPLAMIVALLYAPIPPRWRVPSDNLHILAAERVITGPRAILQAAWKLVNWPSAEEIERRRAESKNPGR